HSHENKYVTGNTMKRMLFRSLPLAAAIALTGCASNSNTSDPDINPPDLVLNPSIEDGIAEATCVQSSGHVDIDRKQAIAEARQGLAQRAQLPVESTDGTYAKRTTTGGRTTAGGTFESVSRQVTEQPLSAATPERVGVVRMGQTLPVCAMVAMRPDQPRD